MNTNVLCHKEWSSIKIVKVIPEFNPSTYYCIMCGKVDEQDKLCFPIPAFKGLGDAIHSTK